MKCFFRDLLKVYIAKMQWQHFFTFTGHIIFMCHMVHLVMQVVQKNNLKVMSGLEIQINLKNKWQEIIKEQIIYLEKYLIFRNRHETVKITEVPDIRLHVGVWVSVWMFGTTKVQE